MAATSEAARYERFWTWFVRQQASLAEGRKLDALGAGDVSLAVGDVFFDSEELEGKLDVVLHVRDYDGSDEMGLLLFVLLDSVVGEHDVETYIAEI